MVVYNLARFNDDALLSFVENKGSSSQEEIAEFLKIFKSCWDGSVVPRLDSRNDDALVILGLTPKHRMEEIKRLRVEDYYRGPSLDHNGDPNKEWWEFGRHIKSYEIYIKISIVKKSENRYVGRCMSFHIADHAITYPYKS